MPETPMQKINVVGTSGSGKTTFGRQLAQTLNCPYLEMDALFWLPNWGEPSDAEFFTRLTQALVGESWILDGNYNRTRDIKWAQVDTVIWLDYSLLRTLYQALKRALVRSLSGREIWPGTGNVETFRKSFLSQDSIVLWTLKTYHANRQRYQNVQELPDYQHIHFIRLRSPHQARLFLSRLASG